MREPYQSAFNCVWPSGGLAGAGALVDVVVIILVIVRRWVRYLGGAPAAVPEVATG